MTTNNRERLLLRIGEAADRLAVGRSTIYELVNAGELPVIHIGRSVRIPTEAVHGWVERRQATVLGLPTEVGDGAP